MNETPTCHPTSVEANLANYYRYYVGGPALTFYHRQAIFRKQATCVLLNAVGLLCIDVCSRRDLLYLRASLCTREKKLRQNKVDEGPQCCTQLAKKKNRQEESASTPPLRTRGRPINGWYMFCFVFFNGFAFKSLYSRVPIYVELYTTKRSLTKTLIQRGGGAATEK